MRKQQQNIIKLLEMMTEIVDNSVRNVIQASQQTR
jgi:hypothetical protein